MAFTDTATLDDAPTVTEHLTEPPERVFDVIVRPATYPQWLVGAKHIRRVDHDWPHPGSAFHHVVGAGPVTIRDHTTVVRCERPRLLELRAHAGPLGVARVRFELTAHERGTRLDLFEAPDAGALRTLWRVGARPLVRLTLWGRNRVSLDRLRQILAES
jgi:uncharacterized protein YndB with AHSA1/START domain